MVRAPWVVRANAPETAPEMARRASLRPFVQTPAAPGQVMACRPSLPVPVLRVTAPLRIVSALASREAALVVATSRLSMLAASSNVTAAEPIRRTLAHDRPPDVIAWFAAFAIARAP